MSLMRQVWLLVVSVIVLACAGSVVVSVWSARAYLENQLTVKNNDNAQALALSMTQQAGDQALLELALAAQFDTGYYRSIRLKGIDGLVRIERQAAAVPLQAPAWFVRLVPIESHPGVAQVSNGWNAIGSVEVISQPVYAYADLWRSAQHTAAWMLLLGAGAVGASTLVVNRLRRSLGAVVEQAEALTQRRFIRVVEPTVPELKRVAQAMNTMVERVHRQFSEQADEVAGLRRQAHFDPLTGVSHRAHFLDRFVSVLTAEDGLAYGQLMLVRVLHLADVNQRYGRAKTDQALVRLAHALAEPLGDQQPVAVGRLNGTDFALVLAEVGRADRSLAAASARLRERLAPYEGLAAALSSVAWRNGEDAGAVLARADVALATAEAQGDFAWQVLDDNSQELRESGGEDSWRRGIQSALVERRVELIEFPLIDRQGRLLHHECPLRIQLKAGGPHLSAAHWLPLALRTGMTAQVDELAVQFALDAIAADAQPRSVNLSPQSLLAVGFVARLRQHLAERTPAARRLSLELDEAALLLSPAAVADLCRQVRPFGTRVGLEHAGERLAGLRPLLESGLDFVKLMGSLGQGIGGDERRATLLRTTVQMLHGLGIATYMEGVSDASGLDTLWATGIDGITGPAVTVR